jgi:DNA-binding GntR family transcriptional regulator
VGREDEFLPGASKREQVVEYLRRGIENGEFAPGDALIERAIAERTSSSRIPIREALLQLEQQGLVQMVPNRGAFVRSPSMQQVCELYEVREAVEGMAARLAAERADQNHFRQFGHFFREFLTEPEQMNLGAVLQRSLEFHEAIVKASKNTLIATMATNIRERIRLSREELYAHASLERVREGAAEHVEILEALNAKDGEAAERLMRRHIAGWLDLRLGKR